jgi:CheY-like chemotaxis protein
MRAIFCTDPEWPPSHKNNVMKIRKKIFIVDDNRFTLLLLGRKLKKTFGCRIRLFTSAHDCIAALEKESPHVILSDYRLHDEKSDGMNGDHLLVKLKKYFPEIPVIIYSSTENAEMELQMMRFGADGVTSGGGEDLYEKIADRLKAQLIRLQRLSTRKKFVWGTFLALAAISAIFLYMAEYNQNRLIYFGSGLLFVFLIIHVVYTVRTGMPS